MTLAIQTNDLTKNFGDFTAVDKINIKINEGTIHGFIGPNGAGKTTTMKMLIGALHPNNGSGTIMGHPIGSMQARKLLGYSPEHPKFYEDMTAHNYLVFMGTICGMSRSHANELSTDLLEWLDIGGFANKKIHGFSAGMRQKLSLAQSLIHEPEILILDEPTANLDPAGRLSIIKKLKELCADNHTTVFISSHVLGELEKLVSEVSMINHGKLVVEKDVSSLEKEVSAGRYILKTSDNHKVLPLLSKCSHVAKAEIDENNIIHISSKGDENVFRKDVTKVVLQSDVWVELFNNETADLEALFMKLVGEGEEDQRVEQHKKRRLLRRFGK
jgi:ABC-2 type transport system ATP-binding protein